MVADEYFDLRSRLGAALFALGRLSDLAGLKPSRSPVVKSLVEGLRDPFVFVVAGEVNAGKSTLLNALFGQEFCAAGVLPETRRIHWFRHGKAESRVLVSGDMEEITLPLPFLRDFHVVDTPGINSAADNHGTLTGDILPRADAVLYCFPATNPWSAAAWEFLEQIHHGWLKKTILVLQQSDLRTAEENAAITAHMTALSRHRLGVELPVFAVSARLALLARTTGLDKNQLLHASAFPPLEQYLNNVVASSGPRVGKLIAACSSAQSLLAEVQAAQQESAATLATLTALQESARLAGEAAARDTDADAEACASRLRSAWDSSTRQTLANALRQRPAWPSALWKSPAATADGDSTLESQLLPPLILTVKESLTEFFSSLEKRMKTLQETAGEAIRQALEGRPALQTGLSTQMPDSPPTGEGTPEAAPSTGPAPASQATLASALESAVCEAVTTGGPGEFWRTRLQARRTRLRMVTFLVLLAVGALAAASVNHLLSPSATAIGAAALLLLGFGGGKLLMRRETAETTALTSASLVDSGRRLEHAARALAAAHGSRRLEECGTRSAPLHQLVRLKQQAATALDEETAQLARSLHTLARTLRSLAG